MATLVSASRKFSAFSGFSRRQPFILLQLRPKPLNAMSTGPTPKPSGSSEPAIDDGPVRYSTSKAHAHSPFDTFLTRRRAPFYQPIIVTVSITTFLIYFLLLREENDVDEELERSLYDKVPGLKEKTILAEILEAREHGRDTTQLELQLKQLRS